VSDSLPGLARFGCDLSATVGGIPNFGQTSQNQGSGHCDTDEKRGPGSMRRSSSLLLGKGRAWHRAGHGRHSSINPAAWAGTIASIPTCGVCRSGIGRLMESGEPRSKSLWEGTISEWACGAQFRIRPCVAFSQQPGEATKRICGTDRLAATQREFTSWAVWAADAAVNVLPGLRRSRQ